MTTLLSYASPWQNAGDSKNTTRKRISSMNLPDSDNSRKTQRKIPDINSIKSEEPNTIEDTQEYQNTRAEHIYGLLNKMNSVNVENDGSPLENFIPPVQFSPSTGEVFSESVSDKMGDMARKNMNNQTPMFVQPYASSLGNSYKDSYSGMPLKKLEEVGNNKMTEKMNYMIYLLEQQQHEETNHITEEFILYTLLGVFIIYIVDSFSRIGKYTR